MDRRILVSGSIASNIALVVSVLVGLALTALVARHLGAAQFGLWAILNTISHYAALAGVGVPAAVTWRAASERGAGRPAASFDAIQAGIILLGGLGVVAGAIVMAGVEPLAAFFRIAPEAHVDFRRVIAALAVVIALGSVANSLTAGLNGLERLGASAAMTVSGSVARLAATSVFLGMGWGLDGVLWGHALSHAVVIAGSIAVLLAARRSVLPRATVDTAAHLLPLIGFASSAAVLTIASNITMTSAIVIAGRILPPETVALVAVAMMLVGQMVSLVVSTMRPLEPRLATLSGANRAADEHRLLYRSLLISAALSFAILAILVVLGRPLLVIWLGKSFGAAAIPLAVAALGFSIAVAQVPLVTLIMAKARHRTYGWLVCAEALANVVLTVWLCRRYGALGAVLGTAIPLAVVRGMFIAYWGCHLLGLDLRRYLLSLVGPAAAAVLTVGLAFAVGTFVALEPATALLAGLPLLGLVYLSTLLVTLRWIDMTHGTDHLGFLLSLLPQPLPAWIVTLLGKRAA